MIFGRLIHLLVAASVTVGLAWQSGYAAAQTIDQLTEKFIGECKPQFIPRGQRGEDIRPLIRGCVQKKLQALKERVRESEWTLTEFTPWLSRNSGPTNRKGVIYFVRGWGGTPCCQTLDGFKLVPYFLKSLHENGWDVIAAKAPFGQRNAWAWDAAEGAALFVKRRVKELKAQGYQQVVIGGHSWGGWVAMIVARDKSIGASALLVNSPNTYGTPVVSGGKLKGESNSVFEKNLTEFLPLVDGVAIPAIMTFFRDDPYEPPERGTIAKTSLLKRNIPHFVVDMPKGFTGHSAGWLPVFDYAFGKCIQMFLEKSAIDTCRLQHLSNSDFRSIVNLSQVPSHDKAIKDSAQLVGKKYAAFTLGDALRHYEYAAPTQRINMYALEQSRESYVFRDGQHCIGKTCSLLLRWSDNEILEFDPGTRNLKAWWIETK